MTHFVVWKRADSIPLGQSIQLRSPCESYVIAYDWERDLPTAKLHQAEADAFHIIAFALVEVLDDVFISQRSASRISD